MHNPLSSDTSPQLSLLHACYCLPLNKVRSFDMMAPDGGQQDSVTIPRRPWRWWDPDSRVSARRFSFFLELARPCRGSKRRVAACRGAEQRQMSEYPQSQREFRGFAVSSPVFSFSPPLIIHNFTLVHKFTTSPSLPVTSPSYCLVAASLEVDPTQSLTMLSRKDVAIPLPVGRWLLDKPPKGQDMHGNPRSWSHADANKSIGRKFSS